MNVELKLHPYCALFPEASKPEIVDMAESIPDTPESVSPNASCDKSTTVSAPRRLPKGWKTIEEKDMSPALLSRIKNSLMRPRITSIVPGTNITKVEIWPAILYRCSNRAIFDDGRYLFDELEFDSIVTDPPYGQNQFCRWKSWGRRKQSDGTWETKDMYKNVDWDDEPPDLTFLLERKVPTIVFGGNFFSLPPSRKWIIWDKGRRFYGLSFAEFEMCWCSFNGVPRIFPCTPDYVQDEMGKRQKKVHPTEKPVVVMKYCISQLPKGTGNIICDPFMGSGSTGAAALQMGRAFIGFEPNEEYFEIACQRLEHALYQLPLFK